MYWGFNLGGRRALSAVFVGSARLAVKHKIKTPRDYKSLITAIDSVLKNELAAYKVSHCCCAIPGWIDFDRGVAVGFGNLPWLNVSILSDLEAIMPGVKVL